MHKLAFFTLAASALSPAIAFTQTVSPADRYEGTPQVPLKKPAGTTARTSVAPAPIASPAAPAQPAAPAGITWRNQAATPTVAPLGRAAPLPAPITVQRVAPPPPPMVVQRVAPPPPAAADRTSDGPPVRTFLIRRERIGDGTGDTMIRREPEAGPTRIIVRRERFQDMASGHDDGGPHHREMGGHYEGMAGHHGDIGPSRDEWIDEGRDDLDDGYIDDRYSGWDGREDNDGFDGPAYGYAPGPCCSGGMITETITTTTTYPPTMEERVSYEHVATHKTVRRNKLRRR